MRRTLADVFDLSGAEFALWHAYYLAHGFDVDRLEHVQANAGSVAGAAGGITISAGELIPRFGPEDVRAKRARLIAFAEAHGKDE